MGLLIDKINNKLERSTLINEQTLNREPVPLSLTRTLGLPRFSDLLAWAENLAKYAPVSSFLRKKHNITGMVALTVSSRLRAMSITFGLFVLLLFLFVVVTLFWVLEVMRGESKLRAFKLAEKNKLRTMDTQPVCFYFAASQ